MERLVVVMFIAAIAPATGHSAFPFPTVDGLVKLHYPRSGLYAGTVHFWRMSETPSDIVTDIFFTMFFPEPHQMYVALVYNASHITDTCRPVGPPLVEYNISIYYSIFNARCLTILHGKEHRINTKYHSTIFSTRHFFNLYIVCVFGFNERNNHEFYRPLSPPVFQT